MGPIICEAQGKVKSQAPPSEGTERFTRVTAECPTSGGPPKPSRWTGTETQRGAGGPPSAPLGWLGSAISSPRRHWAASGLARLPVVSSSNSCS